MHIIALMLALLVWTTLAAVPARAETGYSVELVDVVPDPPHWSTTAITDGHVSVRDPQNGGYSSEYTWTSPPPIIGPGGVSISLDVTSTSSPGNHNAIIELRVSGFELDVPADQASATAYADQGRTVSASNTVQIRPAQNLNIGDFVELKVGAGFIAGVLYRYRVVGKTGDGGTGDGGTGDGEERRLAAHLDCPPSIIVSELPSLNCHVVITSWRYSSDPVEVFLPDALDIYGNHANGIQLLQAAGEQDVFNWNYPDPYMWGMFVFACPSQSGTGANCFGSVTPAGPQTVNIIVRQGAAEVPLQLNIVAIPRISQEATACGFILGQAILDKWNAMGREGGVLGCARSDEAATVASSSGTSANRALFAGGAIFLHSSGNLAGTAFEVHGCIASRYLAMGGPSAWLGLPISDEYDIPGGRRSDFEDGYFVWDQLTGGCMALRDGSASVSFEPDTNRAGYDYTNFPVVGDRLEICRDACAGEQSCAAFTYVHAGVQGTRGMCWLKSDIPAATVDGCCISGVRR